MPVPMELLSGSAIVDIIERGLGEPETLERDLKAYVIKMKSAL